MGFFSGFKEAAKRQLNLLELRYLGGHPDYPSQGKAVFERKDEKLLIFNTFDPDAKPIISIPLADIENVTIEKGNKRSLGKAAAGAIVGGVLTGGIGAIAGAAIGGRSKDNSIIVLTIRYGKASIDLLFSGDDVAKKYARFVSLLR